MSALPDLLPLYEVPAGRHVRGGMVLSADGGAAFDGTSGPLGTPTDKAVFSVLRAHADVVLVGAGTARQEAYGPVSLPQHLQDWRVAAGRPANPPLALLTRSGDVPAIDGSIVLRTDARAALDELADRGLLHVLCEGGPSLLGTLVREGLLDELCCTLSPHLVGSAPGILTADLDAPVTLRLAGLVEHDSTLLLRWDVAH